MTNPTLATLSHFLTTNIKIWWSAYIYKLERKVLGKLYTTFEISSFFTVDFKTYSSIYMKVKAGDFARDFSD